MGEGEARTISAGDQIGRILASDQRSPPRPGTIRGRLLRSMDSEVARSFTEAQLRELERVLTMPSSRQLPIDIRMTVPLFWRRYFITILAGPERRSAERLKQERAKHPLLTVANVCSIAFLLFLFIPTFIGLVHIFAFTG